MVDPATLTWRCEICRAVRPDAEIAVYQSFLLHPDLPGVRVQFNVKYCRDQPSCAEGATHWATDHWPGWAVAPEEAG